MPFSASAAILTLSSSLMADAVAMPSSLMATIALLPGTGARQSVVEGKRLGELGDPLLEREHVRLGLEGGRDDLGDLRELSVPKSTRGERRRTDANTRRSHRRTRVERHGIPVHGDADGVQDILRILS